MSKEQMMDQQPAAAVAAVERVAHSTAAGQVACSTAMAGAAEKTLGGVSVPEVCSWGRTC